MEQITHLAGPNDKKAECGIVITPETSIDYCIAFINCKKCLELTNYGGRY